MTKTKRYFYVKPIRQVSAQGRHLWSGPDGKPLETTKSRGATTTFSLLRDRNGLLRSGLDYRVPNDQWKAKSAAEAALPSNWRGTDIWQQDTITRQEQLEVKYNLPPSTLTNIPNQNRKKYTYLQVLRIRLEDRENRFSLDTLDGELFFEAAKVSKLIANTLEDVKFSPYAQFYISQVNEDEEIKASKNRIKAKGAAALETLKTKYSGTKLKEVGLILGLGNTLTLSEEAVYNRVYDYIDDSKHYQQNISTFLDIVEMLGNKSRKPTYDAKLLLKELLITNVVSENKGAFYWNSKRGSSLHEIGLSEQGAIQFLMDKNRDIHINELRQELKIKKNEY